MLPQTIIFKSIFALYSLFVVAITGREHFMTHQVVVDEEDVALLEGQLIRVRHLGVRQDGHHPLPVVHLI